MKTVPKGRHFEASLILQAVSWYLRYPLSYRDIEELFLERGLKVDHSTLNRWVLAYAPLIERRLRSFRKPHCGSIRIDETYIKIRGQWRYLYRAIDKHGTPVDFLLTATRDLKAAKRFFRKMLKDGPLLAPDRIGADWSQYLPAGYRGSSERGAPAARSAALRHQAPAIGDRERPFPGQAADAADRRLSIAPTRHDERSGGLRPCCGCGRGSALQAPGRYASRTSCCGSLRPPAADKA